MAAGPVWALHPSGFEDENWEASYDLLDDRRIIQQLSDEEAALLMEYCPLTTTSSPDSRYVLLGREERKELLPNQRKISGIPTPEEIYVSKYFFARQANGGYPWLTGPPKKISAASISSGNDDVSELANKLHNVKIGDPGNVAQPSRGEVQRPNDAQNSLPPPKQVHRGMPDGFRKIPIRDQDGVAWLLPILWRPEGSTTDVKAGDPKTLDRILDPKFWKTWEQKASKPSKRQYLTLRSTNPEYRLWIRPGYTSDTLANGALAAAFNFESKAGVKTIYLIDDAVDSVAKRTDFVFLSENPFQHYTTWIHKDDLRNYFKDHPSRPIPTKAEVEAASKVVMISRGKQVQEAKDRSEVMALEHWLHDPLVDVKLTNTKMDAARGKRSETLSQGRLMGSASNAAFDHLQWKRDAGAKTNRLRSGMFMAEWLHLAAFSFGGILEDIDNSESEYLGIVTTDATPEQEAIIADELKDLPPQLAKHLPAYHSSQIPSNLMLGTSETNSVMLRYETAWQHLSSKEFDFRKSLSSQELGAEEAAKSKEATKAKGSAGPVVEGGLMILASDAHPLIQAGDATQLDDPKSSLFTATKLTPEQMNISTAHPWLKFVVDYYVSLEYYSGVLQQFRPSCQTTFYPFLRLFFTLGESLADKKLVEGLAEQAKASSPEQRAEQMVKAKDKWRRTVYYKLPYRYQIGDGYLDEKVVRDREAKKKFPPSGPNDTFEKANFRGVDERKYI